MRIVTLHAICSGERLTLVRFDEGRVFGIVAVKAQRRSRLGQVIVEFDLALLSDLVGNVASLATHIPRGVPAALLRNVDALLVTGQTQVLVGAARRRLQ